MMFGSLRYLPLLATLLSNFGANAAKSWKRQLPAEPTGVQTLTSPSNVTIRFKNPGAEGVCETTPGVDSYAGYVDLDENTHAFFWFFEARHNPAEAPITLWLNGGPGSDSLIGLFQGKYYVSWYSGRLWLTIVFAPELGPCNVTEDLKTQLNPYAWNEVSNMLFLSQPVGVGFSYSDEEPGSINQFTGVFQNASIGGVDGRK